MIRAALRSSSTPSPARAPRPLLAARLRHSAANPAGGQGGVWVTERVRARVRERHRMSCPESALRHATPRCSARRAAPERPAAVQQQAGLMWAGPGSGSNARTTLTEAGPQMRWRERRQRPSSCPFVPLPARPQADALRMEELGFRTTRYIVLHAAYSLARAGSNAVHSQKPVPASRGPGSDGTRRGKE